MPHSSNQRRRTHAVVWGGRVWQGCCPETHGRVKLCGGMRLRRSRARTRCFCGGKDECPEDRSTLMGMGWLQHLLLCISRGARSICISCCPFVECKRGLATIDRSS